MAYQALYRKYRPHNFNDVVDQDNVKKILTNSILNEKVSHAYLFSGPRGIGKTSIAKIFAKAINCQNFSKNNDVCDECDNCIECNNNSVDIIEIDAASNNGVDQIRELKNKISIVPSKLKYKVYIVDEVHMLTNSAFNALLKTLEEPPSHVIFILATTEFYEVPETIVSRCQCFSFSRISMENLAKRIKYIADNEKIKITEDAINEIAQFANGGLRDAIGMLDKLNSFNSKKITVDDFKAINGLISFDDIVLFFNAIFDNNINQILELIDKIDNSGYDFKNFVERLMYYSRDIIIKHYTQKEDSKYEVNKVTNLVFGLNELLNQLKSSLNPKVLVQVYILKFTNDLNNISREMMNKNETNISREMMNKNEANISREMMNKNETNISREMMNKNETNISREMTKENIVNNYILDKETLNIRINNALATANINYKKKLSTKWGKLDTYFDDEKFNKVSQLLIDTEPMVVGTNNLIITAESQGIVDNLYMNLDKVEDLIKTISETEFKCAILTLSEFEIIKNQYVKDKKDGITYNVKEEKKKLISYTEDNLINRALNIFGNDIVEIE